MLRLGWAMGCLGFSHNSEKRSEVRSRRSVWGSPWSFGSTNRNSGSERNSQTDVSGGSPSSNFMLSSSMRRKELQVFTYSELKSATRNFHRMNLLGEGGFGCVYKGYIKHKRGDNSESKVEVAVKQLNGKGLQGHKEWLSEIRYLALVDDPNLVKLIGYCMEDDERGMQLLLVYEFMPRGSLENHLFRRGPPVLSWETRVKIALGAARGLAYLHEELEIQIIYRDFKTSNILLDHAFDPKLSDFGLARIGPEAGDSHVTTDVVGTIGYTAPEYVLTGHLTSKSDVWSFGVVLLELMTGRKALDKNRPKNEQRLLEWVKPYLTSSRKLHMIMDPKLEGEYSFPAAQKMASLAASCLSKHPKGRPKMSELVEGLKVVLRYSSPETTLSTEIPRTPEFLSHKQEVNVKEKNSLWRRLSMPRLVRA